ncbi:MAG: cell division protein FtsQ/DivIB [Chloroflexi bacterium]|nr:cell division protein FtsQ/DivIB [Chloroflexota bacterium]MBU1751631.1 cell division protein FtsQ/DivIB [Chloroflexota bacterium]
MARPKKHISTTRSSRRRGQTTLAAANDRELALGARRTRRGLNKLGRRVLALVVVLIMAGIGWQVVRSSLFRITRFQVIGSETVGQADIVQAANLWDQSIFLADFGAAAERVQGVPGIQVARVRGVLPDCCAIEVIEREPQLIWQVAEARYWVDGEGVIIPTGQAPPRAIVIVSTAGSAPAPGDQVDAQAIRTVQQLDQLLPTDLRPAHYEYTAQEGVVIPGAAGWRACFGDADHLDTKIRVLQAILTDVQARNAAVSYIDLRPQGRPYVR